MVNSMDWRLTGKTLEVTLDAADDIYAHQWHIKLMDKSMHEAQMSMAAYLGKQMGYTKTGRSLRVKCPIYNHYHCCARHVCEADERVGR